MNQQFSEDIITDQFASGAIINTDHEGFPKDYLVLWCLLKKYKNILKTFVEIGTHQGTGTKIIKSAVGAECIVYSMDLPYELGYLSWNYTDRIGINCNLPFIQLRADSTKFDFCSIYPIDGWYIDGGHAYENVFIESQEAIKSNAKLIVWHDADIDGVYKAIIDAFQDNGDYDLFRVQDTRIAYALRKKIKLQ